MDNSNLLFAFALTALAGLSTGFGSVLALLVKRSSTRFLCVSLGFSAGVMIYLSFVELLAEGNAALIGDLGKTKGSWVTVLSFFGGMGLIALIDRLVPTDCNPHEVHGKALCGMDDPGSEENKALRLKRTGFFTALALTIHNFPEGLATFTSAMADPTLGIAIAIAVALHNIPEGIAVSVPIYYATGSKKKALKYSFLSGLAEPAGAVLGYLLLRPFFTPALFGVLFSLVAGIMVFISLDELLPAAEEYGEHHLQIYGLVLGMAVMALSLLLLK